jgi:hypothetical protein
MTDECGIYNLPLEILGIIASTDVAVYRALLSLPRFARSLSPGTIVGFMIAFGYSVKITKYRVTWYLNGKKHKIDVPAVDWYNGDKEWWWFGKRHRQDRHRLKLDSKCDPNGPAVEWSNGTKEWWLDGNQHRADGPAVEYAYGGKEWWINGVCHRQADRWRKE